MRRLAAYANAIALDAAPALTHLSAAMSHVIAEALDPALDAPEALPAPAPVGAAVDIITFGCRLNTYESAVMRQHATAGGLANAVVIHTCAVTAHAVRDARQAIRRARRDRPDAKIIVTGCAAQIDPQGFAAMPEVDQVLGNAEKLQAASFAADRFVGPIERVRVNDIMAVRETAGHLVDGFEGRARAYVQVQNGCDHRCTFCVIPYGRGNSRSAPAGDVVAQVRRLVEAGYAEIVLTGVDLTSWGGDLPGAPRLGDLVARLLKLVPDLRFLRLSSIDAIELDPLLEELISTETKIQPHLHLSLQSGDPLILKRMKRRHSPDEALALIARLRARRPEIAFGADFIVGFPTETNAQFDATCAHAQTAGLGYLHVFPFSARPGTPAAKMPPVDAAIIRERSARLRALGDDLKATHFARLIGWTGEAIIERAGQARLPNFAPARIADHFSPGVARLRVIGATPAHLIAEAA